jgi:hypothetical protein
MLFYWVTQWAVTPQRSAYNVTTRHVVACIEIIHIQIVRHKYIVLFLYYNKSWAVLILNFILIKNS